MFLRRFVSKQYSTMAASLPKTNKVLQIHKAGGPDVLQIEDIPLQPPAKGEVLIKNEWAGVNFIDTYCKPPALPSCHVALRLGQEASGTVAALGEGVESELGLKEGDRVVAMLSGGFAQYSTASSAKTFKVPDKVASDDACSVLTQGLTAAMLVREYPKVTSGQWVGVHAAAGGMGLQLCQILKELGVHVIGTTSTEEKAKVAKEAGAEHVVLYANKSMDDVAKDIKALTPDGKGVDAVYDGVGKDTFQMDKEILKPRGFFSSYGNASGTVPPFSLLELMPKGLKVARPSLNTFFQSGEEFREYCNFVFGLVAKGKITVTKYKDGGYPFTKEGVSQAQEDITGRKTTGKLLVKIA